MKTQIRIVCEKVAQIEVHLTGGARLAGVRKRFQALRERKELRQILGMGVVCQGR